MIHITLPQNEAGALLHDSEGYELVNLAAIVRQCRMSVCEAYFTGRHSAALAALAAASIQLYRYVDNGSLDGSIAYSNLREVAGNLTLTKVLGEDAVEQAIDTGPQFFDNLAGVA